MSSFWQQMPFVRILIPYITGIIFYDYFPSSTSTSLILLTFTGIAYLCFKHFHKSLTRDYLYGPFFNFLFFLSAILMIQLQEYRNLDQHFSTQKSSFLLVQIKEKPLPAGMGYKAEGIVISSIDSNRQAHVSRGKLLLYFKNSDQSAIPAYGDQILIQSGFQEINAPRNPDAFHYKQYMKRKGISHVAYLKKHSWLNTHKNQGALLLKKVFAFQDFIRLVLQKNLKQTAEIAIAEALLYGYDDGIEEEITDAYSKTGTLHVLAVSGMHVGLLFMILSLFLKPLENRKGGKQMAALIQIGGIWFYSVLCGLSPSILRATVMFTFVIVGKRIRRSGNPFNSLSASASLLLFLDPQLIFNVGFQLSYAAVLGILGFYPALYLLISFRYTWIDEIWKILSVSIAAQVLTLPLSIYYFHQIPNYFLLANLIIIPLSSLIIYLGIFLLVVSPFEWLSLYTGKCIGLLIRLINGTAQWIAGLPFSYTDRLYWNGYMVVLFYLILLSLLLYFFYREMIYLKSGLFLLWIIQCICLYEYQLTQQQNLLTFYDTKGDILFQYTRQNEAMVWTNSDKNQQQHLERNILLPHQLKQGIESPQYIDIDSNNHVIHIGNNFPLLVLQNNFIPANQHFRCLFITGNAYQNIKKILENNRVDFVVINRGPSPKKREAIKKIMKKMHIPFHDITENGAIELSL